MIHPNNALVKLLMAREDMSRAEVVEWIQESVEEFINGSDIYDIEEILHSEFGVEPDYLYDLLEFL